MSLLPGRYYQKVPLHFGRADSGNSGHRVLWQGPGPSAGREPANAAVVHGGIAIPPTLWKQVLLRVCAHILTLLSRQPPFTFAVVDTYMPAATRCCILTSFFIIFIKNCCFIFRKVGASNVWAASIASIAPPPPPPPPTPPPTPPSPGPGPAPPPVANVTYNDCGTLNR